MSAEFEPRNELEKRLLAAQEEKIGSDDLLDIQRVARAQPLVLTAEDGIQIPERAQEFISDDPGFSGGILTEFTWVLEKMGRDFAIALNPGLDVGFDMQPETVNELVDSLGQQARH